MKAAKKKAFCVDMKKNEYLENVEEDNGLCLACAGIRYGMTEPDAVGYDCEECGEAQVMGIEMALCAGYINVTEGGGE